MYRAWRGAVFARDGYTCQSCLKPSADLPRGGLTAHHIATFKEAPRLALKKSNGITLCWQCHRDFHRLCRSGELATRETRLQEQAAAFFRAEPGVWFFKVHGGPFQETGLPDFLGAVGGRAVGIELKIFPAFVTPLQKYQMQRLQRAGGLCFVCYSIEEVRRAVTVVKETLITDDRNDEGR